MIYIICKLKEKSVCLSSSLIGLGRYPYVWCYHLRFKLFMGLIWILVSNSHHLGQLTLSWISIRCILFLVQGHTDVVILEEFITYSMCPLFFLIDKHRKIILKEGKLTNIISCINNLHMQVWVSCSMGEQEILGPVWAKPIEVLVNPHVDRFAENQTNHLILC